MLHAGIISLAMAIPAAAQGAAGPMTENPPLAPEPVVKKVPILGDLPLIGRLFQTASYQGGLGVGLGGYPDLQSRLETARAQLAETKVLVKKGELPASDLRILEKEIAQIESEIRQAEQQQAWQAFVQQLDQPVEVELRNATLQQAAEALRQSSGINIAVGDRIPQDLRFNVLARRIPLSFVLEGMARQGNLMLAPPAGTDQRGIVLQSWPVLEINGKPEAFPGPLAPWSSEWKYLPTVQNSGFGGPRGRSITSKPPAGQPATSPGNASFSVPAGLQLGVGGGMVVVAEPGVGPKGEVGNWLTVYRLQGTELKKVTSTFHRAMGGAAQAPRANEPVTGSSK
jgi:hypothetical protein